MARTQRLIGWLGLFAALGAVARAQDEVRVFTLDPRQVVRTSAGAFERVDLVGHGAPVHRPEVRPGAPDLAVLRLRVAPVEDALVTISAGGQVLARARTDAQGGARVAAPAGAVLGVSAVSTPATPDRAFLPLMCPLARVVVATEVEPAPATSAR